MKVSDDLILVKKKNGKTYFRRQRKDYKNPALKSPAKREQERRFAQSSHDTFGETGLVWYKGRLLPKNVAFNALAIRGRVNAEHRSQVVEARKHKWRLFEATGRILVKLYNEIVAVI